VYPHLSDQQLDSLRRRRCAGSQAQGSSAPEHKHIVMCAGSASCSTCPSTCTSRAWDYLTERIKVGSS
jgi:hypothetical protein